MAALELLTQLQDQLHTVSKMFFDFVGILQRDAPPLPVNGEALITPLAPPPTGAPAPSQPPPAFDVEATTQLMASQLVEQFKLTEALIKALPSDPDPPPAQFERIRALQREHAEVTVQLDAAAAEAEAQLVELQRMYALLAQRRLRDAQQGIALPPLPPLAPPA
jgi:hypothetical protein